MSPKRSIDCFFQRHLSPYQPTHVPDLCKLCHYPMWEVLKKGTENKNLGEDAKKDVYIKVLGSKDDLTMVAC